MGDTCYFRIRSSKELPKCTVREVEVVCNEDVKVSEFNI